MHYITKWLVLSALVAALLTGCRSKELGPDWPAFKTSLADIGMKMHWKNSIALPKNVTIKAIYRLDEYVYCLTTENYLLAIDAQTGVIKWRVQVAGPGRRVYAPVHAESVRLSETIPSVLEATQQIERKKLKPFDALIINTISQVLVFDRSNGKKIREIELKPQAASTNGATDGNLFYFGSSDGRYHGLALYEAVPAWSRSTTDNEIINASIRIFNKRIYVAGSDGSFYAADMDRRKKAVKQKTTGPIIAPFHVDKRGSFVGSTDQRLYAYNLSNTRKLWDPFICGGPIRSEVQVTNDTIYIYAQDDKFYAIDIANGKLRWSSQNDRKVLAVEGANVYLLDEEKRCVRVVTQAKGQPVFGGSLCQMLDMDMFLNNTTTDTIFAASSGGRVMCIKPTSTPPLTQDMIKASK